MKKEIIKGGNITFGHNDIFDFYKKRSSECLVMIDSMLYNNGP